jgi:hypothetical protein
MDTGRTSEGGSPPGGFSASAKGKSPERFAVGNQGESRMIFHSRFKPPKPLQTALDT